MSKNIKNDIWKLWFPPLIKKKYKPYYYDKIKENNSYQLLFEKYFKIGVKKGFKIGYKTYIKDQDIQLKKKKIIIVNKMNILLKNFDFSLKNMDDAISNKLVNIIFKVVSKLFMKTIHFNKQNILISVRKLIQEEILSKDIILKINIKDKIIVEKYFKKLLLSYNYIIKYRKYVRQGECVIEFGRGILDTTLHSKWKALLQLMFQKDCDNEHQIQ
ncbi:FliH/SctL family protein [Buchnera aphidicola]|uniref:FliH/SctL family protein n=1 Tax=Buchnera aphidicola TaxID=9 RepID=UPI0034647599